MIRSPKQEPGCHQRDKEYGKEKAAKPDGGSNADDSDASAEERNLQPPLIDGNWRFLSAEPLCIADASPGGPGVHAEDKSTGPLHPLRHHVFLGVFPAYQNHEDHARKRKVAMTISTPDFLGTSARERLLLFVLSVQYVAQPQKVSFQGKALDFI